jgi:molybdopterin/thiamine biosynthesis adenylyltransferase
MKSDLSEEEVERYSRQISLKEIGLKGQLKLKKAKVCIVGMGGLGTASAVKLAAMGIGYIRLVDRDVIGLSDLHRQLLYDSVSIGLPKVEVAAEKLALLNPNIQLDPLPAAINSGTVEKIIFGVDAVVDGLDSIETRYLINRACHKLEVPYFYGGAIENVGNASTIIPGKSACLECYFPGLADDLLPKCALVGVHPSILGIITSVQVSEVVRWLTGEKPMLLNTQFIFDIKDLTLDKVELGKNEKCSVCGNGPPPKFIEEKILQEQCSRQGDRTFTIVPREMITLDIKKLSSYVNTKGFKIEAEGTLGITFRYSKQMKISILRTGVAIFQVSTPRKKRDLAQKITQLHRSILVEALNLPNGLFEDAYNNKKPKEA